jgi:transcriptional regulator with XRE-family HTH domain
MKNRIRLLRKKQKLTYTDLGEKTGIHYSTLSRIEKNQRTMTIDQAWAIADYFQTSIDYLICRVDKELKEIGLDDDGVSKIIYSPKFRNKLQEEVYKLLVLLNDNELSIVKHLLIGMINNRNKEGDME